MRLGWHLWHIEPDKQIHRCQPARDQNFGVSDSAARRNSATGPQRVSGLKMGVSGPYKHPVGSSQDSLLTNPKQGDRQNKTVGPHDEFGGSLPFRRLMDFEAATEQFNWPNASIP